MPPARRPQLRRATRLSPAFARPARREALVALACLLGLSGCSTRLAGTNDAALEYVVDEATRAESDAPVDERLAAAGVKARLSSAQIPAQVDATDDHRVRVVVDADAAGAVDSLVLWRGGVRAYRVEDSVALAPADTTQLNPMSETRADGTVDHWWEGPADAVSRAVNAAKLDGLVALAERLPSGQWRTRLVASPPIVELGWGRSAIASIEPALHGRAIAMTFVPGARDPIAAEQRADPRARIALARGRTVLATMTLDQALATPLIVTFGDDVSAYTRAYHTKLLLGSPVLPGLSRTSAERLPPRWGLAAACALLPFLLSFAWLFFVRRFDRARPEPLWLVAATFALGGLSVVPAAVAELACSEATPWLDPSVMTLGGQAWALPVAIVVFTLVIGVSEEGSKLLGAWTLARHRREFDEPVDGIVYACAAALGFAAIENVKYFALGRMSGVVIAVRAFVTVPAHMFFGAIWGYAMGRQLVSRKASLPAFFALAALAHGAFDAMLSTDGMQLVATLLVLGLAIAFVAMLRSSLRHGAVPGRKRGSRAGMDQAPITEPVPASALERTYFRVGSPVAFYACASAMVACAFALTVLGGAFELLHHRIGPVFVAMATTMLALFGFAAYGATETLPLDVAIDAQGVTFAGARTPWGALLGLDVDVKGARAYVVLRAREGVARLGPATPEGARAIAASIQAARG